ncbi:MAG: hypothetical protein C0434_16590 [Xanthomonadaceae bacterium]|nr:hypothetical protein [Xanthomonadaceae bacterium]
MRHSLIAATVLVLTATPLGAAPAAAKPAPLPPKALERVFEFRLTVDGQQSWKNGAQATEASTRQEYVVRTSLRSDGVLYSDNLLDLDQAQRLEIKPQYYARRGLNALKAINGGKLPDSVEAAEALAERYQKAGVFCFDSYECNNRAVERLAALNAMRANSRDELEEFLAAPGIADVPRYLYFFGYANCPIAIRVKYDVQVKGTRAFDRDKKKLEPYALSRTADTAGSEDDQKTLCEKYIVTVDTLHGGVFVENLFLPSPPGTSVMSRSGLAMPTESVPLPPPFEVLNWTSEKLRATPADSFKAAVTLPLNAPLDGDYTVQGQFAGNAKVSFAWSFKPAGAAPALPPAVQDGRKPVTH